MAADLWTREQLLVAFALYGELPFGKLHSRNPEIIKYAALIGRTPSALAMKLTNIASLDPQITDSGRTGLTSRSKADEAMWAEMNGDWQAFTENSDAAFKAFGIALAVEDTDSPEQFPDYTSHNRTVTTSARVNQPVFRRRVLSAYRNRCCISGMSVTSLLMASHIKPWAVDAPNRLNPRNGLCLSALHDRAFDRGLITLDDQLIVVVSPQLRQEVDPFTAHSIGAYHGQPIQLPNKFRPDPALLAYHRAEVFERCR